MERRWEDDVRVEGREVGWWRKGGVRVVEGEVKKIGGKVEGRGEVLEER